MKPFVIRSNVSSVPQQPQLNNIQQAASTSFNELKQFHWSDFVASGAAISRTLNGLTYITKVTISHRGEYLGGGTYTSTIRFQHINGVDGSQRKMILYFRTIPRRFGAVGATLVDDCANFDVDFNPPIQIKPEDLNDTLVFTLLGMGAGDNFVFTLIGYETGQPV